MDHRHPRQDAFDRYVRLTNGPLTILALVSLPLLIIPAVAELSRRAESAILAADYGLWAIFAADYLIRVYLAPQRGRFVRTHIPDLVIVVLPMLRAVRVLRSARVLRLLRLARLAAFTTRGFGHARAILRTRGLNYVLLIGVVVMFLSASLVMEFERRRVDATIKSFPDALWWAATTVTTVGYGDTFPRSAAGRGVAVFLMVTGIALFGVLTASIAAYFVEQKEDDLDVNARLDQIAERLAAIERRLP